MSLCSGELPSVVQFWTFMTRIVQRNGNGNALSYRVATEILKIIREDKILEQVTKKGLYLHNCLYKHRDIIKYIRGIGLMLAIEFDTQEKTNKFFDRCLENDILLMKTSYPRTLRIIPPLNISYSEIDQFSDCVDRVITYI